jgi:hypothetical protein
MGCWWGPTGGGRAAKRGRKGWAWMGGWVSGDGWVVADKYKFVRSGAADGGIEAASAWRDIIELIFEHRWRRN